MRKSDKKWIIINTKIKINESEKYFFKQRETQIK
jgi:hypothetical protein